MALERVEEAAALIFERVGAAAALVLEERDDRVTRLVDGPVVASSGVEALAPD